MNELINKEINEVLKLAGVTNLKENNEINLSKANRIAGHYFPKTNEWKLLPRTTEKLSIYDKRIIDYSHDANNVVDIANVGAIRFSIEQSNNQIICVIESARKDWIRPFLRLLYRQYPNEMVHVSYLVLEWYIGNYVNEKKHLEMSIKDFYNNNCGV